MIYEYVYTVKIQLWSLFRTLKSTRSYGFAAAKIISLLVVKELTEVST